MIGPAIGLTVASFYLAHISAYPLETMAVRIWSRPLKNLADRITGPDDVYFDNPRRVGPFSFERADRTGAAVSLFFAPDGRRVRGLQFDGSCAEFGTEDCLRLTKDWSDFYSGY